MQLITAALSVGYGFHKQKVRVTTEQSAAHAVPGVRPGRRKIHEICSSVVQWILFSERLCPFNKLLR